MPSRLTTPPGGPDFGRWAAPVAVATRRSAALPSPRALLSAVLVMLERSRSRRDLAGMDARLLRDVGIDPCTRAEELRKWLWQR